MGGQVVLHEDDSELTHHTFIYAPNTSENGQRFRLAARMLDFPNLDTVEPPAWIPADAASVMSLNWNMKGAFQFAGTLVNELAKDDVFEDVLDSIRDDENGPQIDLREEVVAHLNQEAWLVTRIAKPITPTSEWKVFAFGVDNAAAVAKAVDKALENDPYARRRKGHDDIWEIFEKTTTDSGDAGDASGFGFGANPRQDKKDERLIKNGAITVQHGFLMFATEARFLEEIKGSPTTAVERRFARQKPFGRVMNALKRMGDARHAGRFFVRHHAIQAANYELMREGKMPQSSTTLGQILNWFLAPEEKEIQREQEIDGSKLPPYEQVESYLGVGGLVIRTESDGWLIWGCMLPPEQP